MSVVAAYGMLAYRLASHTGSEVTFNPTFFFYFSVCMLQKKWELNSRREKGEKSEEIGRSLPLFFLHYYLILIFNLGKDRTVRNKKILI